MTTGQAAKEFCRTTLTYGPGGSTEVPVYDGRTADLPGWEECGFELLTHRSALNDWSDDEEITRVHHPEMAELARKLTGCDHALLASHIRRSPEEAKRHSDL